MPFITTYLRDSKCESFTFMATPEMASAMTELKINLNAAGHYDLFKLTKDQYIKFRYHFLENRLYNKYLIENKN